MNVYTFLFIFKWDTNSQERRLIGDRVWFKIETVLERNNE